MPGCEDRDFQRITGCRRLWEPRAIAGFRSRSQGEAELDDANDTDCGNPWKTGFVKHA